MGIANIGIPGLILIVILALIIFGPKKLPEIGKAAGQTLKEFKGATSDMMDDKEAKEQQAQAVEEQENQAELKKND